MYLNTLHMQGACSEKGSEMITTTVRMDDEMPADGAYQTSPGHAKFTRLWACYYPRVMRYFLTKLQDRDLAEDLAMEVFLRLWVAWSRGGEITVFSHYLFRVAGNLCKDWYAQRERAVPEDALELLPELACAPRELEEQFDTNALQALSLYATDGNVASVFAPRGDRCTRPAENARILLLLPE